MKSHFGNEYRQERVQYHNNLSKKYIEIINNTIKLVNNIERVEHLKHLPTKEFFKKLREIEPKCLTMNVSLYLYGHKTKKETLDDLEKKKEEYIESRNENARYHIRKMR